MLVKEEAILLVRSMHESEAQKICVKELKEHRKSLLLAKKLNFIILTESSGFSWIKNMIYLKMTELRNVESWHLL